MNQEIKVSGFPGGRKGLVDPLPGMLRRDASRSKGASPEAHCGVGVPTLTAGFSALKPNVAFGFSPLLTGPPREHLLSSHFKGKPFSISLQNVN